MGKIYSIKFILLLVLTINVGYTFVDINKVEDDDQYYDSLYQEYNGNSKLEEVKKRLELYIDSGALLGFYIFTKHYDIDPLKFFLGLENYFLFYNNYLEGKKTNKEFENIANSLNFNQFKDYVKNPQVDKKMHWRTLQAVLTEILKNGDQEEKTSLISNIFSPLVKEDVILLLSENFDSVLEFLRNSVQLVLNKNTQGRSKLE